MPEITLLERANELQTIATALEKCEAGTGVGVIFVLGVVGSGRSSLLKAARAKAANRFQIISLHGAAASSANFYASLCPNDKAAWYPYFEAYRRLTVLDAMLKQRVEVAQLALGLPDVNADAAFEEKLRTVQALPPEALHYLIRKIYTTYNLEQLSEMAAAFLKTGLEHLIQLNAANLIQLRSFVDELKAAWTVEEWEFYLRPELGLARALGTGLAEASAQKPVLITLDDYTRDDRLFGQIVQASGTKVGWLFAAEERPAWANGLPNLIELYPAPLSRLAIADFFAAKFDKTLTEPELEWLLTNTKGLPLAVQMITAILAGGSGFAEIETALLRTPTNPLEGLLLYLIEESGQLNTEEQSRFYMFGFLREPDRDFIIRYANAVKEAGYPYESELTTRLFETYRWAFEPDNDPESFPTLHPALKNILLRHLLVERLRFSPVIEEGIIEPARNVANERLKERENELVADPIEQGSLRFRARDVLWDSYVCDNAYYRLWLDEGVGFLFLMPRMVYGLAYHPPFAHRLLAVIETLSSSFYNEGAEFMPVIRALLVDSFALNAARNRMDEKLKALEVLESLSFSERGRWFRNENLGKAPGGAGSAEAEVRGLIRWMQGKAYEETAQYDRAIALYESTLATNVGEMTELRQAAGRAALYVAVRSRLRGSHQTALDGFARAVELVPTEMGFRLLLWQSVRVNRPDMVLKAVNGLLDYKEPLADLYAVWALWVMGRLPEALTEARTFASNTAYGEAANLINTLNRLANLQELPEGLEQVLEALNPS